MTKLGLLDLDLKDNYIDNVVFEELLNRYCNGVYKRFPDDIAIEKIMNDGRRFV